MHFGACALQSDMTSISLCRAHALKYTQDSPVTTQCSGSVVNHSYFPGKFAHFLNLLFYCLHTITVLTLPKTFWWSRLPWIISLAFKIKTRHHCVTDHRAPTHSPKAQPFKYQPRSWSHWRKLCHLKQQDMIKWVYGNYISFRETFYINPRSSLYAPYYDDS